MTDQHTLWDFIDLLTDNAARHYTDFDDEDQDAYWQAKDDANELKLTKLELAHLCAEAIDELGILDCVWCGVNTSEIHEYYMVTDALWGAYGPARGCACIGCLEKSMGRRLRPDDFTTLPSSQLSERLRDRLGIMPLFDIAEVTPQP